MDNPLLNAEFSDPPVYTWCGDCEEPIYVGDEYFETPDGACYCGECMDRFKKTAEKKYDEGEF